MKAETLAPGAAAIILYRQVDRDDTGLASHEDNYIRIKILTEEGRKYADVEIPFDKSHGNNIVNIHARTIRPDGTIATFQGKAFEKTIVKAKGVKYLAKTFTLPDVQVGSILEYYYTLDLGEGFIFDSHWILSDDLFTKAAKFSLKPYSSGDMGGYRVKWSWQRLPADSAVPKQAPDSIVRLEVKNIPAFQTEDYMPPENELKSRVDFVYSNEEGSKDTAQFWKNTGKRLNSKVESFVNKRKAMEQAVAQIVSPSDSPEVKLRKIYERVQKIRNTSFEVSKSEQEQKRDKEKSASNVEDILKRGYADGTQLTWLFLGLARGAGFEAYGIMASDRRNYFFNPKMEDSNKLDTNIVMVKLNDRELYFDPGAAFTPYGLLPWDETGVPGIRLDKDGGTFIQTPVPPSSESRVERKADLKLTETGDLEGKLTVTYTGLEARQRRVEQRHNDDAEKKKFLEQEVKEFVPASIEVELLNKPDWNSSSPKLVAEFDLKVPGWAAGAGRRALLGVGLFGANEKRVFEHADRVHPIYFEFPFEQEDDVTITPPLGWSISSLPQEQVVDAKAALYTMKAVNDKGTLHVSRNLRVDLVLLDSKFYNPLRTFFQAVRTGDEEQIVLQPIRSHAGN